MPEEIKQGEQPTDEAKARIRAKAEEMKAKAKETAEVIRESRGKLLLTTPIEAGADEEITELEYDFNLLTGLDVVNAMDSDTSSTTLFRVSHRQSLSLFAAAAAKCTPELDSRDIQERLAGADVFIATQLAVRFFTSSTQAGQQHLSRK